MPTKRRTAMSTSPCWKCPFLADCRRDIGDIDIILPCFETSPRHAEFEQRGVKVEEKIEQLEMI